MLFRPNTVFQIQSTLGGTSEIGQFYSGVDNIAMLQLSSSPSPVMSSNDFSASFRVDTGLKGVSDLLEVAVDLTRGRGSFRLISSVSTTLEDYIALKRREEDEAGSMRRVTQQMSSLFDPQPLFEPPSPYPISLPPTPRSPGTPRQLALPATYQKWSPD